MKILAPVAALFLLAAVPATAADNSAPKVVAFNASVKVEVDAAGKPTKVEAPADLPDAIRSFIEKRVAGWQYEPAKQNGVPASAVTYVRVGACAIPVAEGYRLGLDFKGNGPSIENPGPWFMPPPRYPTDLVRAGVEGTFKVGYLIQPDGTTKVTLIEPMEGTGTRHLKSFRSALTDWIEDLRYQPEQVNGMPVATEMSFPVSFALGGSQGPRSNKAYREELEARTIASKECMAASTPSGPLPIAMNSPIKVMPVPAG